MESAPPNLWKNKTRAAVMDQIRRQPGSTLSEIAAAAGAELTKVLYHVRILERESVVIHTETTPKCYFASNGGTREQLLAVATLHTSQTRQEMIRRVREKPGITRSELGVQLGMTRTTVAWHTRRLVQAGIVREERAGRFVRHFPAESPAPSSPAEGG